LQISISDRHHLDDVHDECGDIAVNMLAMRIASDESLFKLGQSRRIPKNSLVQLAARELRGGVC
jgi:hypothetical protein